MNLMSEVQISIRNLFKIFGNTPFDMISHVESGIDKNKLLAKYGHVLGLNDIHLDIKKNNIHVIMGLSGSGKSTLIRHLNRLIEPTAGEIIIGGKNIISFNKKELRDFRRFQTSMVFQNFSLFPHRTVLENVSYGLLIQDINRELQLMHSRDWVDRVGLNGFENYYPSQLSGGMQQRVGLARALATDAEIILMDEPFSALDPLIRAEMQEILIDLQKELKKTIVFITHDLDEALRLGDHIAILSEGKIIQSCQPQEIILNPVNDYVTDFIKNINRGRILKVGSIMNNDVQKTGLKIDKNIVLEDAVKSMLREKTDTASVTDDTRVIGSIELVDILEAMTGVNSVKN